MKISLISDSQNRRALILIKTVTINMLPTDIHLNKYIYFFFTSYWLKTIQSTTHIHKPTASLLEWLNLYLENQSLWQQRENSLFQVARWAKLMLGCRFPSHQKDNDNKRARCTLKPPSTVCLHFSRHPTFPFNVLQENSSFNEGVWLPKTHNLHLSTVAVDWVTEYWELFHLVQHDSWTWL